MHTDTVTLFNRLPGTGDTPDVWYPTVLYGCNLVTNRAAIISKYGSNSADNALLIVPYTPVGDNDVIEGKLYREPKAWTHTAHGAAVTFTDGNLYDFFVVGDHMSDKPVSDADYPQGFYQYMQDTFDGVYAITGHSRFKLLPHYEVTAR